MVAWILRVLAVTLLISAPIRAQSPLFAPPAGASALRESAGRLSLRTPTPIPPPNEARTLIENFYATLKSGETQKAYDALLAGTRLKENRDSVSTLVSKTDQALGIYGKVLSHEVYDQRTIGARLMSVTYLTHHPMQPLRWRFVFYKPEAAWMLIDVRVDDVLEDLVQ